MKGNKLRGFLELSGGVLLAIALMVTCSLQVNASPVPGLMAGNVVQPLPPATPIAIEDWVIYLIAGLVVVAAVVVIVLLLMRRRTSKKPAHLGRPPTTPPPMRPAMPTPPVATPQQSQPVAAAIPPQGQPVAAAAYARLIMPDNTEVTLSEGMRFIGRSDFERMVPPDRADYISRQHLAIGFASGSYYVEDAGSGNGTKLNGRDLKGKGSQWLKDGDQVEVGGVAIFIFKTS